MNKSILDNITIIISHPDDEVIFGWMVLKKVKRIICVSNDLNVTLPKSTMWEPNWINRQKAFKEIGQLLGIEVINLGYNSGFASLPKEEKDKLTNKIHDLIKDEKIIYTHNAWGEYGHPDHILVHDIVKKSKSEILTSDIMLDSGFTKFKSFPKPKIKDYLEVINNDLNFYEKCKQIYTKYDVWTWNKSPILKTNCYLEKENEISINMKNIITLKNDKLSVDFDLNQGGMPVKDNFGFIHRYGIEIGWIGYPHPYTIISPEDKKPWSLLLQSTAEKNPTIIKQTNSELSTSGIMQKHNLISPHVYKFGASLIDNKLSTSVELEVKARETCLCSKVWIMTKFFEKAKIGNQIIDFTSLPYDAKDDNGCEWLGGFGKEYHHNPPKEIILYNNNEQLKIEGYSVPPVYFSLIRYRNQIIEVVFGWAELNLNVGLYKGEMNLTYEK